MSLHYLLDGYNIIHQMPYLDQQSLEDARAGLIQWIQRQSPQGSARNKVTIVFDGQGGLGHWSEQPAGVQVIFTSSQSADDYIKQQVANSVHPKNMVVVTDDREIQYFVRAQGAKVMAVDQFGPSSPKSTKQPKSSGAKSDQSKHISMRDQYKINQELENRWLKSDE